MNFLGEIQSLESQWFHGRSVQHRVKVFDECNELTNSNVDASNLLKMQRIREKLASFPTFFCVWPDSEGDLFLQRPRGLVRRFWKEGFYVCAITTSGGECLHFKIRLTLRRCKDHEVTRWKYRRNFAWIGCRSSLWGGVSQIYAKSHQ